MTNVELLRGLRNAEHLLQLQDEVIALQRELLQKKETIIALQRGLLRSKNKIFPKDNLVPFPARPNKTRAKAAKP